jgi:hypothetical protein
MQYVTPQFLGNHYTDKIYVNYNSLSKETCINIINQFESEDQRSPGHVRGGVRPDVKHTTDYTIDRNSDKWSDTLTMLKNELYYNIDKYIERSNSVEDYLSKNNHTTIPNFEVFKMTDLICKTYMVQKYNKGAGRYIYHHDFRVDPNMTHRVLTFLWYLNDVEIGGETVFEGAYAVRPQAGKLILFPSSWTYIHCGKMPISSDKYIITGWIYLK